VCYISYDSVLYVILLIFNDLYEVKKHHTLHLYQYDQIVLSWNRWLSCWLVTQRQILSWMQWFKLTKCFFWIIFDFQITSRWIYQSYWLFFCCFNILIIKFLSFHWITAHCLILTIKLSSSRNCMTEVNFNKQTLHQMKSISSKQDYKDSYYTIFCSKLSVWDILYHEMMFHWWYSTINSL